MSEIIQQLSLHACFLTAFAILLRMRQAKVSLKDGLLGMLLNLGMLSLSSAYLQKAFSRIDGEPASLIDLWRECSLLLIVIIRVIIGGKERN